jgi:hypothetical protein
VRAVSDHPEGPYTLAEVITVLWDDGTTTEQANVERPSLLFINGQPSHLFLATGTGPRPYVCEKSWVMVIPLKVGSS